MSDKNTQITFRGIKYLVLCKHLILTSVFIVSWNKNIFTEEATLRGEKKIWTDLKKNLIVWGWFSRWNIYFAVNCCSARCYLCYVTYSICTCLLVYMYIDLLPFTNIWYSPSKVINLSALLWRFGFCLLSFRVKVNFALAKYCF